jgi:tetratricopeptide (TPR) repeat protein
MKPLLGNKGDADGAIAEFRQAIRLKKDYAAAHYNLANVLRDKGDLDGATAEFRQAIGTKQNFPEKHIAHTNLGLALRTKGDLDGAIAEYRDVIRLKKDHPEAHTNLGDALLAKGGRLDEAIAEFREAIGTKQSFPEIYNAHNNLGKALHEGGNLDGAIAECREAIRLKNDFALAHCTLGHALHDKGQFAEALTYLRSAHELGSKDPRWPYPSAQWVRECERLVELDAKLPQVLKGEVQPADVGERLAMAQLCQLPCKLLNAAAVGFYSDAFAQQPQLADDLQGQPRYNAACAAALAGCGQGKDAGGLDEWQRASLRQQALDWLRADLAAWNKRLENDADKTLPAIVRTLDHWLKDADFAGVRGDTALAKLSEAERRSWQQLWGDVAAMLTRAQKQPVPAAKSGTK